MLRVFVSETGKYFGVRRCNHLAQAILSGTIWATLVDIPCRGIGSESGICLLFAGSRKTMDLIPAPRIPSGQRCSHQKSLCLSLKMRSNVKGTIFVISEVRRSAMDI